MVIGNKRTLAIEYRVSNPVSMTAQTRFWFENQPLESLEDLPFQDLKNASRDMHFATFSYAELAALIAELKAVLAGGHGH